MTKADISNQITNQFSDAILSQADSFGVLVLEVTTSHYHELVAYCKNELNFQFITDLTGVHFPEQSGRELCLVTHLHNLVANVRVRIKTYVSIQSPKVPTIVDLYSGANWMERETYDFYGIEFEGHPELKRILNVDEMDYFPMRKEYQMEDPTRLDKDDEMFGRN